MATKKQLTGLEWKKAVGQTSLVRVDYKSFDDELPKNGEEIIVIFKFSDGYMPVHAEFLNYDLDGRTKKHNFTEVRFRDPAMPAVYYGNKLWKNLIAWGRFKLIKELTKECPVCKQLICQC